MIKISVVYHSKTGNTKAMAECIVKGLTSVDGVEARCFEMDAVDGDYVRSSCGLIVGTPVYAGGMSGKTATWLETQAGTLALAGKVAGAFATAGYVHGGGDLAMQSILAHLLVFGCLAYSSGAACGKPVIHLGPVALADNIDAYRATFETYGKRMAAKCVELFGK